MLGSQKKGVGGEEKMQLGAGSKAMCDTQAFQHIALLQFWVVAIMTHKEITNIYKL